MPYYMINKETVCKCEICGEEFKTICRFGAKCCKKQECQKARNQLWHKRNVARNKKRREAARRANNAGV